MNTKRIFAALTASAMALSLCACAGKTDPTTEPTTPPAESGAADPAATPETTPETTPEATPEPKDTPAAASGLSDDLLSGQVSVNGTVITLPVKMAELTALGYGFDAEKAAYVLNPRQTTGGTIENADGSRISVGIYNLGDAAVSYSEAMVDDLYFAARSFSGDIQIAKGITLGSTYDEVIAAYGEPEDRYEDASTNFVKLSYETPDDAAVEMEVEILLSDGVVNEIDLLADEA